MNKVSMLFLFMVACDGEVTNGNQTTTTQSASQTTTTAEATDPTSLTQTTQTVQTDDPVDENLTVSGSTSTTQVDSTHD